jgi:hypothetical protein
METIIIRSAGKKLQKVKAYLKSLDIAYKVAEPESPYDPEFVKKIERSIQQVKEGKVTRIKPERIWK